MTIKDKIYTGIIVLGLTGLVGGIGYSAYNGIVGETRANILAYKDDNKAEDVESLKNNYRERNKGGLVALAGLALLAIGARKRINDQERN